MIFPYLFSLFLGTSSLLGGQGNRLGLDDGLLKLRRQILDSGSGVSADHFYGDESLTVYSTGSSSGVIRTYTIGIYP